jgi:pimeloyl-ACP methyl ester carboxylesterase
MASSIHSLFAHGGPGMNSFAEEAILGPLAKEAGLPITFWNEPSRLRPDGWPYDVDHPYLGWLSSLEATSRQLALRHGPINLIAHSFAAGPALEIARKAPESIGSLTLIAGSFDPWASAMKIIQLALSDFRKAGDFSNAGRLERAMTASHVLGDEAMIEGLLLSLADPVLFDHYYFSSSQMRSALEAIGRRGAQAQVDLVAFENVFRDMHALGLRRCEGHAVETPTMYISGEMERVIDFDLERPLHESYLGRLQVSKMADAGHFAHLDQPAAFLERVAVFLDGLGGARAKPMRRKHSSVEMPRAEATL